MKKIVSAFLVASFSATASNLVYCPEIVECTYNQCTVEQDDNQYWSMITSPWLNNGQYQVSYISAPYRLEDGGYPICVYTHTEYYQTLTLRARLDAKLVIFEDENTGWRREESWGECRPDPLSDCPLQALL
jgi:hypothetical protein